MVGDSWRHLRLIDDSGFGRAKSIVGYASKELNDDRRFPRPDRSKVERHARLFRTWADAAGLDDETFHDRYIGHYTCVGDTSHLRRAAHEFAHGSSFGDMADAGWHLARAIGGTNVSRWYSKVSEWPHTLRDMETLAAAAAPIDRQTVTSPLLIQASATRHPAGHPHSGHGTSHHDHGSGHPDHSSRHPDHRGHTGNGDTKPKDSTKKKQPRKLSKKENEANALGKRLSKKSGADPFMAYAFPVILYAEGGYEGYPPAGITLTTYHDMLKSAAIRDEDRAAIRNYPPTAKTIRAYYRAYLDNAMRRVVSQGGYDMLNLITDPRARLAFIDALFARGESEGPSLIRQAIKQTLEQLGRPPSLVEESGVMKSGTFDEYRKLADDPMARAKLIENLENILTGTYGFGGRKENIHFYLDHRAPFN